METVHLRIVLAGAAADVLGWLDVAATVTPSIVFASMAVTQTIAVESLAVLEMV